MNDDWLTVATDRRDAEAIDVFRCCRALATQIPATVLLDVFHSAVAEDSITFRADQFYLVRSSV